jgi:hypothetical protein
METLLDGWCLAGMCIGLAAGVVVGMFVGMRLYWRTGKW